MGRGSCRRQASRVARHGPHESSYGCSGRILGILKTIAVQNPFVSFPDGLTLALGAKNYSNAIGVAQHQYT